MLYPKADLIFINNFIPIVYYLLYLTAPNSTFQFFTLAAAEENFVL